MVNPPPGNPKADFQTAFSSNPANTRPRWKRRGEGQGRLHEFVEWLAERPGPERNGPTGSGLREPAGLPSNTPGTFHDR